MHGTLKLLALRTSLRLAHVDVPTSSDLKKKLFLIFVSEDLMNHLTCFTAWLIGHRVAVQSYFVRKIFDQPFKQILCWRPRWLFKVAPMIADRIMYLFANARDT